MWGYIDDRRLVTIAESKAIQNLFEKVKKLFVFDIQWGFSWGKNEKLD